jgi:chaperonin GroES
MNLKPLYDRVVVKPIEADEVTAGGIVIPDTAKEKPEQGEVIAVGHGRLLDNGTTLPLQVKPGERILFGKYAGQTVKIDDEEFLVLKEEDVLGVIEAGQGSRLKKAA